jgi:hypothetical protein
MIAAIYLRVVGAVVIASLIRDFVRNRKKRA